jgi:hypothetical protein
MEIASLALAVFALIISFYSYKKVNDIKKIDLRILLKKDFNQLHRIYTDVIPLMINANKSRLQTLAALGRSNSGDKIRWETLHTEHEKDIAAFKRYINMSSTHINSLVPESLEAEIVKIDKVLVDVKTITKFYESSMNEDREHSKQLMDAAIARHQHS